MYRYMESAQFKIRYEEKEQAIATTFLDIAGDTVRKIDDLFEFESEVSGQRALICLCSSIEEYIKETGKTRETYQDWMVGWSDYNSHKICILSPEVAKDADLEYMKKIMVHEIVHMEFDTACKMEENEAWLSEGIAILLADQTDLQYVSEKEYPTIKQISGKCEFTNTPEQFIEHGGYDYAGIYVWYYIKKYGKDQFLRAYKNQILVEEAPEPEFEKNAIASYKE